MSDLVGHWMSNGGPLGCGVGGRKEGRGGTSGQLGNEKAPQGEPYGARREGICSYLPFPARAERSIRRKHTRQSAR